MIEISAIISTYNRAQFLEGLFDSILAQTMDTSNYEVVIVNNNSTDDTEAKCQKFILDNPGIKITYCVEEKQGLSYGRNRGIQESTGEILTFLDDDAVIAEDFFEKTVDFFQRKPHINAIGGKILLKYLKNKPDWYNPFLASLLGYFNKGDQEQVFKRDYFRGSNMSFRKALFEKYGGFNTTLGRVGKQLFGNEEKELFYRFKGHGEEIWYVPSTVVLHLVPIERTYADFIKRQALGTGKSQRQHALIKGKLHFLLCLASEFVKWLVTMCLSVFYTATFRIAVASMLLRFRWWVSKGIIQE